MRITIVMMYWSLANILTYTSYGGKRSLALPLSIVIREYRDARGVNQLFLTFLRSKSYY